MLQKYFKNILFIIIFFIIIFNCSNVFAAVDSSKIDFSTWADKMIANGVGEDIGNSLIEGGYLGEKLFDYGAESFVNKFCATYSKNGQFYLMKDIRDSLKPDDEYIKGMHDIYVNMANQLKEQPEMADMLKRYNRYAGISNDEYARAFFERIAMEIFSKRIDEFKNAYKKGCNDKKAGKFKYNGKEYKCSEISYIIDDYCDKIYSYDLLKNINSSFTSRVDNSLLNFGGDLSDDFEEEIYKNNQEITGKDISSGNKDDGKEENSEDVEFSYSYYASYYPNLTNAIKFANDFKNAGELENLSDSNFKGGSIKNALDDIIQDFSDIGIYILYGAILFFGIRTIWSGVNGKVEFKETLPYILVAIVLFYLAPNLVNLLQKIFGNEYGDNYLSDIWGSVVNIVQIVAFAGILFSGVKFMLGAHEQKADIKKSLISILVGSILVFTASTVVSIVLDIAKGAVISSSTRNVIEVNVNSNIIKKNNA